MERIFKLAVMMLVVATVFSWAQIIGPVKSGFISSEYRLGDSATGFAVDNHSKAHRNSYEFEDYEPQDNEQKDVEQAYKPKGLDGETKQGILKTLKRAHDLFMGNMNSNPDSFSDVGITLESEFCKVSMREIFKIQRKGMKNQMRVFEFSVEPTNKELGKIRLYGYCMNSMTIKAFDILNRNRCYPQLDDDLACFLEVPCINNTDDEKFKKEVKDLQKWECADCANCW